MASCRNGLRAIDDECKLVVSDYTLPLGERRRIAYSDVIDYHYRTGVRRLYYEHLEFADNVVT